MARLHRSWIANAGLVVGLLLFAGSLVLSILNTRAFQDAVKLRVHTDEVIAEIRAILSSAFDMESAERGFAISGEERFSEAEDAASGKLQGEAARLRSLTADNPRQQGQLDALERLLDAKIRWTDHVIDLRRREGPAAALAAIGTLQGSRLMEEVRATVADLEAEERRLLAVREAAVRQHAVRMGWSLAAAGILAAVLSIVAIAAMNLENRRRRRAELEARRARTFFESVVENIPTMVFVKEARDLRFVHFNRAGEELLGFGREEMLGRNVYDLFPRDQADFFARKDREVLEGDRVVDIPEEPVRTRGRGTRLVHTWKAPIPGPAGRPSYLLGISEDITERKEAEARIAKLNEDLRIHAARLEAANRELEAFSYSVSHDLRAPLRHLDGFADLLAKHLGPALDATGLRYVETIRDAARRMGLLIDDLLAFSRTGRTEMQFATVPLGPLVDEVVKEMEPAAKGRRIDWRIGELPEVKGDRALLRLALGNLISNALKFTRPRSEARIEVGARCPGGEVEVFVRDNGVGFDDRYAHKLFGVFQRLHGAGEFEGTGIGLANVRRIVARHGGRTWGEGSVGEGATFHFTLPR